jgi:hypothetical protein
VQSLSNCQAVDKAYNYPLFAPEYRLLGSGRVDGGSMAAGAYSPEPLLDMIVFLFL